MTSVFHFIVGMKDAKEPFGVNQGIVHVVIDSVQLTYGGTHIGKQHDMVHDFTDSHARILDEHEICGEDNDEHSAYLFQKTLQTVEEIALLTRAQLQVSHSALNLGLAVSLDLLAIEGFDNSDALYDVQNTLADGLMPTKNTPSASFHSFGLYVSDIEVNRHDTYGYQPHIDIGHEHQHQRQDSTGEQRQNLYEEIVDCVAQAHDSPVYARLQFSGLISLCREKCHSEGEHSFDHTH